MSVMALYIYMCISSLQGFFFSTSFALVILLLFDQSHSSWDEEASHHDVIYISLMIISAEELNTFSHTY